MRSIKFRNYRGINVILFYLFNKHTVHIILNFIFNIKIEIIKHNTNQNLTNIKPMAQRNLESSNLQQFITRRKTNLRE